VPATATAIPEQLILIAGIGPFSSLLETLATTVGAGLVLGSFAVGVAGLIAGGQPTQRGLARAGYLGGVVAATFFLLDAITIVR
jgi:hypothetical protein